MTSQKREARERNGDSIEHPIVTKEVHTDPQFLAPHVAELGSDARAILDLSLRYGFSDERLAATLQLGLDDIAVRRELALADLAERAGLDPEADRPQLEQALRDVPHETWLGRELRDPAPEPEPAAGDGEALPPPPQDGAAGRAGAEPRRRSRRWMGWLAAAAAAAAVIVLIATAGGDDDEQGTPAAEVPADGDTGGSGANGSSAEGTTPAGGQQGAREHGGAGQGGSQGQGAGQSEGGAQGASAEGRQAVTLKPILGAAPSKAAISLVDAGPPPKLAVRLDPPSGSHAVYVVWLYDTVIDARPIAFLPSRGGATRFDLPAEADDYRYIDVSAEKRGGFPGHSGRSLDRLPVSTALAGLGLNNG